MDVNGNDNAPEWGYCTTPGCSEPAEPLWFSGGFPDDPDLLLCYKHIGMLVGSLLRVENEHSNVENGLAPDEQKVMEHLVAAWNIFMHLNRNITADDQNAFRWNIHGAQHVLAQWALARTYPEYWQ